METEIMSLATMGSSSPAAGQMFSLEGIAKCRMDELMRNVHFSSTPEKLMQAVADAMRTQPRVVLFLDGSTTEKEAFGTMVDVAKKVWDLYAQGSGASPGAQTMFRIILLLGSRWDIVERFRKKAATL